MSDFRVETPSALKNFLKEIKDLKTEVGIYKRKKEKKKEKKNSTKKKKKKKENTLTNQERKVRNQDLDQAMVKDKGKF